MKALNAPPIPRGTNCEQRLDPQEAWLSYPLPCLVTERKNDCECFESFTAKNEKKKSLLAYRIYKNENQHVSNSRHEEPAVRREELSVEQYRPGISKSYAGTPGTWYAFTPIILNTWKY